MIRIFPAQIFEKQGLVSEPGFIGGLSRCWEKAQHFGSILHFRAGQDFSFLSDKRLTGKFAYIRKGCIYTFMMLPDQSSRLRLVVNEGSLLFEAYTAAGGHEHELHHRPKLDTELVCFDGKLLHDPEFHRAYPELIANVMHSTALKYIKFDALLSLAYKNSALEKVAWYLLKLSEEKGGKSKFVSRLSQNEIASLLTISQASMTRAIRKLKDDGIIEKFTRQAVIIKDWIRLEELAKN